MAIPESLIALAGFVLAHAAWSVSDLPEGELLTPFVVVETSDARTLSRFEAATQWEAINNAKVFLAERGDTFDAWVFAREGRIQEAGAYVDVLTVEARAKGMEHSIAFLQRFQPFAAGEFRLLGPPMVVVDGEVVEDGEAEPFLAQLHQGILSHSEVAPLWNEWLSK